MGCLFGFMANRTDRLLPAMQRELGNSMKALPKLSTPLPCPDFGVGLGFYQGGEALHKKLPAAETADGLDVARDVRTDCAVFHLREATVGDFRVENTHPFRIRNWLFAHAGTVAHFEQIQAELLAALPDFLRRSIRGETDSEHFFALLLAQLQERTAIDNPDIEVEHLLHAATTSLSRLSGWQKPFGAQDQTLAFLLTNGRIMAALHRGQPNMGWVVRQQEEDPGHSDSRAVKSVEYVGVISSHAALPADCTELAADHLLVVRRGLQTATYPLPGLSPLHAASSP